MEDLLPLAGVALIAAFTQGVIGFGFGMVAMALTPFWLPYPRAVALVAVFCGVVNLTMVWRYRRSLTLPRVGPMVIGAVIGVPLGVVLLKRLSPEAATRILGVIVASYALWHLLERRRKAPTREVRARGWGVAAGAAGGMLGGAFNAGGPPAVIYCDTQQWPQATFKATLNAFFLSISMLQLTLYATEGILQLPTLEKNAMLAPAVVLGLLAGARFSDRLDRQAFQRLVLLALLVIGVVYLVH